MDYNDYDHIHERIVWRYFRCIFANEREEQEAVILLELVGKKAVELGKKLEDVADSLKEL